jgi:hypothetical protein
VGRREERNGFKKKSNMREERGEKRSVKEILIQKEEVRSAPSNLTPFLSSLQ